MFASLSQGVVKGALQVYTRRYRPDDEVVYREARKDIRGRYEPCLKLHVFLPPGESGDAGAGAACSKSATGKGAGAGEGASGSPLRRLRPCVVLFFGGAWIIGAPHHFYRLAHDLSRANDCVCVCAEYRLKSVSSPHITPHDATAVSFVNCFVNGKCMMCSDASRCLVGRFGSF